MNLTQFFDFETSNLNGSQIQTNEGNAIIANSIRLIIEEVFMMLAPSFVIVMSSRRKREIKLYMNVMQNLFNMLPDMHIQLVYVDYMNPKRIEGPRFYNLLLVDSYDSFLDIDVISYTKQYNFNEYYHIFLMQLDRYIDNDMQRIFNYCWQHQIINCNIEFQNVKGELHMFTYIPYGPDTCDDTKPQHINQFVGDKWLRKPYFLPKVKNFYSCPLVGAVRDISLFAEASDTNGTLIFQGIEIDFLNEMAKRMNFSTVLQKTLVDDRLLPESGGGFNMVTNFVPDEDELLKLECLDERTAHFAFGYYRKRASTADRFTTTAPHFQSTIVTAINYKAHKLSPFEVLMFPFGIYTWSAMAACFILTLMLTQFVRWRHPRAIRTFSMVASTFGIPIRDEVHRLESILIFTPWVWCTLILRSMYSGQLYHLFSNDLYQRLPLTLLEATADGYLSVMNEFTFKDVQDVSHYSVSNQEQNTIVIRSNNEMVALDYLVEHDNENVFGVIAEEFLKHYMVENNKTGIFYTIPEILMQQQLCFYLTKHSFLINQFDEVIMNLKSVGFLKFLMRRYLKENLDLVVEADKMIHQKDLYGIYITCGGLCSVAAVIFILELLSKKIICLRSFFELVE